MFADNSITSLYPMEIFIFGRVLRKTPIGIYETYLEIHVELTFLFGQCLLGNRFRAVLRKWKGRLFFYIL